MIKLLVCPEHLLKYAITSNEFILMTLNDANIFVYPVKGLTNELGDVGDGYGVILHILQHQIDMKNITATLIKSKIIKATVKDYHDLISPSNNSANPMRNHFQPESIDLFPGIGAVLVHCWSDLDRHIEVNQNNEHVLKFNDKMMEEEYIKLMKELSNDGK